MGSVVITSLAFLTVFIWISSIFFLISLSSSLSILLIFYKKPVPGFINLLNVFSSSLRSTLILVISCLLLAFRFVCYWFSSSFNFDNRVSILDLPILLIWALIAVRFWVGLWFLNSNLIALWSERLFVMISVVLHFLRSAFYFLCFYCLTYFSLSFP